MDRCTGKKKIVQTADGLKWKCLKCKEEWNIDPRNLKVARLQLGRRAMIARTLKGLERSQI